jgi:hypothetical protein
MPPKSQRKRATTHAEPGKKRAPAPAPDADDSSDTSVTDYTLRIRVPFDPDVPLIDEAKRAHVVAFLEKDTNESFINAWMPNMSGRVARRGLRRELVPADKEGEAIIDDMLACGKHARDLQRALARTIAHPAIRRSLRTAEALVDYADGEIAGPELEDLRAEFKAIQDGLFIVQGAIWTATQFNELYATLMPKRFNDTNLR